MFKYLVVVALVVALMFPPPAALADFHHYEGTARVDSNDALGEFFAGDLFDFSFTYDDSQTDTEDSPTGGLFPNAITAMNLSRRPGNVGTWDPAGGTFDMPGLVVTQVIGTGIFRPQPGGTGFPDVDGDGFWLVSFQFEGGFTIDDTGGGQTLAEQMVGGPLGGLDTLTEASLVLLNFDGGGPLATITALSVVPEPSAFLYGGLIGVLSGCGCWVKRRFA